MNRKSRQKVQSGGTSAKNRFYRGRFRRVPYSKRILFLPQCLRNHSRCRAADIGWGYVCKACGSCKIAELIAEARELGYHTTHILKGGRALEHVLKGNTLPRRRARKPDSPSAHRGSTRTRSAVAGAGVGIQAVLGVACKYEGTLGITQCEKYGIIPQFVPLLRDGCVNTDVDWSRLRSALRLSVNR